MRLRTKIILALSSLVVILSIIGCTAFSTAVFKPDDGLNSLAKPYSFNFASWEFDTLFSQLKQRIINPHPETALNSQSVVRYFSYMAQINTLKSDVNGIFTGKLRGDLDVATNKLKEVESQRDALQGTAEQTIARQITETLASLGIYNPINNNWLKITFPPVNFKLEKPLYMLIISPRDKIEKSKSLTIKQDITRDEIEELEASIDQLNVSSLIVEIGGLGSTYPTFVIDNADLRWTIDTAVHEWLHQYMAFRPLGFGYILNLLGLPVNPSIGTINETAASIIGQEIGATVYDRYYTQYRQPGNEITRSPEGQVFDFNREMREIRLAVDNYLAQGQVEQAETFMKDKKQYLASNGYYIRKLNQAYFAFYGSYADSPTSVDPIGDKLELLRKHSISITDFLNTVSGLRNVKDLDKAISKYE